MFRSLLSQSSSIVVLPSIVMANRVEPGLHSNGLVVDLRLFAVEYNVHKVQNSYTLVQFFIGGRFATRYHRGGNS